MGGGSRYRPTRLLAAKVGPSQAEARSQQAKPSASPALVRPNTANRQIRSMPVDGSSTGMCPYLRPPPARFVWHHKAVAGRFAGLCVLCMSQPASRKGEHVWPSWYLRDQDRRGPGPFAWSHNGEPIVDRDGSPITAGPVRVRLMLPVCASCNGRLEQRFESPAKAVFLPPMVLSASSNPQSEGRVCPS